MTHPSPRRCRSNRTHSGWSVRIASVSALLGAGVLAACGSDDGSAADTLPPIQTTTTTTTMPPTTTTIPEFHVIASGETLGSIAALYGIDLDVLAAYNGIVDQSHIEAGDKLKLPPAGETTSTTAAAATTAVAIESTTSAP